MKSRIVTVAAILAAIFVVTVAAREVSVLENQVLEGLVGVWSHFNVMYHIGDNGHMAVMREMDDGIRHKEYSYELVLIGESALLKCYPEDGSSSMLLMAADIADSTVVLALGTAYIRADSGDGLIGEWTRAKNLSTSRFVFTEKTIDYEERILDVERGRMIAVEVRHGEYSFVRSQRGRLRVHFDTGESVDIVPLVMDDILYLFDLSPRKSLFIKQVPAASPASIISKGYLSGVDGAIY